MPVELSDSLQLFLILILMQIQTYALSQLFRKPSIRIWKDSDAQQAVLLQIQINRISLNKVVSRGIDNKPLLKNYLDVRCFDKCLIKGFRGLQQLQALVDKRKGLGRFSSRFIQIISLLLLYYYKIRYTTRQQINSLISKHKNIIVFIYKLNN